MRNTDHRIARLFFLFFSGNDPFQSLNVSLDARTSIPLVSIAGSINFNGFGNEMVHALARIEISRAVIDVTFARYVRTFLVP